MFFPSLAERHPHSFFFQGLQNLLDRIERMRVLGPEFIDITWCALRCLGYRSKP